MSQAVRADVADTDVLSQVISDVFVKLAPARWLVPSLKARREMFPGYFALLIEDALAHGAVWTTTDRVAAALWLPTGPGPVSEAAGYRKRLTAITGTRVEWFLAFDAALARHHPGGVFHHYLAILAVRPDRQGLGIGSALLRAHHRELDQDAGTAAYLEASSKRSRRLYERHGYVLREAWSFALPAGGPSLWPMWRNPQPLE